MQMTLLGEDYRGSKILDILISQAKKTNLFIELVEDGNMLPSLDKNGCKCSGIRQFHDVNFGFFLFLCDLYKRAGAFSSPQKLITRGREGPYITGVLKFQILLSRPYWKIPPLLRFWICQTPLL